MKISFVIPAYNEEKNIVDCIRSIQAETSVSDKQAEIIVVNNASTDHTKELAERAGARVIDEARKGIIWARKAGFEGSTGDLVANIDADNRLPKGWLEKVHRFFSEQPDILGLSGPLTYYDSSLWIRFVTKIFYIVGYAFDKIVNLGKSGMFQGGNYIVRRDALIKIGGYDTSISFYGEDVDIGHRLSKIGRVLWTFKLPMLSSGRRIQKEGLIVMGFKYGINYITTSFFKHPVTKEYIDVRS